jgi:uncharacterized protein DUF6522
MTLQTQTMKALEFEDGAVEIDATIVADGLGIAPSVLLEGMRQGKITSLSERGIGEDSGRYRLTFFSEHRRFRLVVNENGAVIQRSTVDFGNQPLPNAARRLGR